MKWNFLINFLIVLIVLTGCNDMNNKQSSNSDSIEYSQNIEELANFMNLEGMQLESVNWASGSIIRSDNEELLPSSNDWWINAVLTFTELQDIEVLTKDCDFRYSLSKIDGEFIDDTVKKLTDNPKFIEQTPMEVFDACHFKTDTLANGILIKDVKNNQLLVKLYTS
ncbi:hypothetical protein Q4591_14010 [Shewanella sp. 3_MG-2023]|uniref:hypothetical protein n=1 Tax=Shewanella sp. 3_MG-2023 TaxID=3062635 RepID=UPI0026E49279|nr:hypothetical protein [Shewanella sp. 3_MG-2023]MDO6776468.1 hypothetical protein [Shewanella sp. 3_MG-2023]